MDFKDYKFRCTEVEYLLPDSKRIPTPKQLETSLKAFSRDNLLSITDTESKEILNVLQKYIDYHPTTISDRIATFLYTIYVREEMNIHPILKFEEESNRSFQINAKKSEPELIDLISKIDGIEYRKNTASFENDFYVGIPDIITGNSILELKCVGNYSEFLKFFTKKAYRSDLIQLYLYQDLLEVEKGEIIYFASGVTKQDLGGYYLRAVKWYTNLGYNPEEADKRAKREVSNANYSHIPIEKRIKRFSFKFDKVEIRHIRKCIKSARDFLSRIDEKFNKIVPLPEQSGEKN